MTHVSPNPARPSFTLVIGRELVYSRRYDANGVTVEEILIRDFDRKF